MSDIITNKDNIKLSDNYNTDYAVKYSDYNEELGIFIPTINYTSIEANNVISQLYDKNNNLVSGTGIKKKLKCNCDFLSGGDLSYNIKQPGSGSSGYTLSKSYNHTQEDAFNKISLLTGLDINKDNSCLISKYDYSGRPRALNYVFIDKSKIKDDGVDEYMKQENPEFFTKDILSFFTTNKLAWDYFVNYGFKDKDYSYTQVGSDYIFTDPSLTTRDYLLMSLSMSAYVTQKDYYLPHINIPYYYIELYNKSASNGISYYLDGENKIHTAYSNYTYYVARVTYTLEEVK